MSQDRTSTRKTGVRKNIKHPGGKEGVKRNGTYPQKEYTEIK